MSDDKEIRIGNKKYGESTIVAITAKNLFWAVGIIVTVLVSVGGWIWKDVTGDIGSVKIQIQAVDKKLTEDIENHKKEDFKPVAEEVNDMEGDIKVLYDRTNTKQIVNIGRRRNTESSIPEMPN